MRFAKALVVALAFGLLGTALAAQGSSLATLHSLDKAQIAAKTAYRKAPKSPQAKKRYVQATVKLATATMTSEALGTKVKYRRALRLYREALKVDPNNVEALNNSKLIEDVYRSLHRPIPN